MMKILIVFLILLFSCSGSKNTNSTNLNDSIFRFKVSFISIGAGIDNEAKANYLFFVSDFEKQHDIKLPFETVRWGREGETDFCFKLSGLPKNKQNYFMDETKENLKMSSLVRYAENCECQQITTNTKE